MKSGARGSASRDRFASPSFERETMIFDIETASSRSACDRRHRVASERPKRNPRTRRARTRQEERSEAAPRAASELVEERSFGSSHLFRRRRTVRSCRRQQLVFDILPLRMTRTARRRGPRLRKPSLTATELLVTPAAARRSRRLHARSYSGWFASPRWTFSSPSRSGSARRDVQVAGSQLVELADRPRSGRSRACAATRSRY